MKVFKILLLTFCLLIPALAAIAQNSNILASANGRNYTVEDLDAETKEIFQTQAQRVASARSEILDRYITQILSEDEAAAREISVDEMVKAELKRRVKPPSEAEIKAVYDANADKIGGRSDAEFRSHIVAFLQRQASLQALTAFIAELKNKYKIVNVKSVDTPNLLSSDVIVTVNNKPITYQKFSQGATREIYELNAAIFERTIGFLENLIYSELVSAEAKSLGIESSDLIAREISDKMREFSDDEREALEDALKTKLFKKYNAKFLLKEPVPYVENVKIQLDDPSKGSPNAPVTVVMFTDFQCSACGAAHPILKKVLAEYGDKIRFVVRDFPLEQIHEDAFKAAQAANAAHAQGKFFEFSELLYANQQSLDAASLKKFAAQIGLNQKQFDADLNGERFAAEVRDDMKDGESYGINSTPTIYVNGVKVRVLSAAGFRKAVEKALKK